MSAGSTISVHTNVKIMPITSKSPRLAIPRCDEKVSAPKLATVVAAL